MRWTQRTVQMQLQGVSDFLYVAYSILLKVPCVAYYYFLVSSVLV